MKSFPYVVAGKPVWILCADGNYTGHIRFSLLWFDGYTHAPDLSDRASGYIYRWTDGNLREWRCGFTGDIANLDQIANTDRLPVEIVALANLMEAA